MNSVPMHHFNLEIQQQEISVAIERKVGKSMKFDNLLNMLNHLEEYGFIKKDIISVKSRAVLVWKTCVLSIWKP